jgi:hypothetical protein
MDGYRQWDSRSPASRGRNKKTAQPEPATSPEIYRSDYAVVEPLRCSVWRTGKPEEIQCSVRFSTDLFVKGMLQLPRSRCGKPVNKANT